MKILKIFLGIIIYLNVSTNLALAQDTNYTYTNKEQDKSGLMHYDSRYYDPELGRFLQPDSFDVPNKYAYVSNNPVNRIDPSGHTDYPFYEDSWVFSGIDPMNTDTYSTMFSDPFTIDNNFIVGDIIGPGDNLYLNTRNHFFHLGRLFDGVQVFLAGAGMTEPFGFFFDCADACISLARGNADIFTAMAIVPVLGEAAGSGKMIKLVKMPDGARLDPNTLVEWIKDQHGPSNWSGGNNYALLFSEHWSAQRLMFEQIQKYMGEGLGMMITTAQEYLTEMQKYYKKSGMSDEAIKRMGGN